MRGFGVAAVFARLDVSDCVAELGHERVEVHEEPEVMSQSRVPLATRASQPSYFTASEAARAVDVGTR